MGQGDRIFRFVFSGFLHNMCSLTFRDVLRKICGIPLCILSWSKRPFQSHQYLKSVSKYELKWNGPRLIKRRLRLSYSHMRISAHLQYTYYALHPSLYMNDRKCLLLGPHIRSSFCSIDEKSFEDAKRITLQICICKHFTSNQKRGLLHVHPWHVPWHVHPWHMHPCTCTLKYCSAEHHGSWQKRSISTVARA